MILYAFKTNHLKEGDLHDIVEEHIQSDPNEEVNQEHYDYIELWFQKLIEMKHPSLIQQLFASYHLNQLVYHTLVYFKAFLPNLTISMFVMLLGTWLHWKYS